MKLSYIVENRIEEDQPEKERHSPLLSRGSELTDTELLEKLDSFGIKISKKILNKLSLEFISAEELSKWFFKTPNLQSKYTTDMEIKRVWIWLTVLWERWFPKRINYEMVDDRMAYGYDELDDDNVISGCEILLRVWYDVLKIMKQRDIKTLEEFDEKFRGTYSVSDMANDIEDELWSAGNKNKKYLKKRISFCRDFLKRFPEEDSFRIENFKCAMAESYLQLGKFRKVNRLYKKWLRQAPEWGRGWVKWSDCFWQSYGDEDGINDLDRAESILKQGLAVVDVRDRPVILDKLWSVYNEKEDFDKADEIQKEIDELEDGETNYIEAPRKIIPRTHKKIPRNKPCPCGSGKKYKKCCGNGINQAEEKGVGS
ncbi:hypothetical protein FP828_02060 [bacterium]|nr:hypothetical protein [bacterium]